MRIQLATPVTALGLLLLAGIASAQEPAPMPVETEAPAPEMTANESSTPAAATEEPASESPSESGDTGDPKQDADTAMETPVIPVVPMVASEPEAQPLPTAADDTAELDEVVVTAQRRVEPLQKAAVAIDAIEGDDMAKSGIVDMRRLSERMPSLVSNGTSGVATYVRGVGTASLFSYTDPAVSFNYDGIYFGRSTSTFGLFYDLERVELLKGPQGTLYGRNATGGALNILPNKPNPYVRLTGASLSVGDYNAHNFEGFHNQPVGDSSALRLSLLSTHSDGFNTDGGNDREMQAGRLQWLSQVSDDFTWRIAGDFAHVGGYGEGRTYIQRDVYDPNTGEYTVIPTGFSTREGLYSERSEAYRRTIFDPLVGRNLEPYGLQPYMDSNFYGFGGELNWQTDLGTVSVIPAWRAYTLDTLVGNGSPVILQEQGDQYSVETRLSASEMGMFDYTAGVYLFHEAMESDGAVTQQSIYSHQNFENSTDSGAVFGRLTAHVTETLRLVGGMRYTQDKKEFDGLADGLVLLCANSLIGVGRCPNARLLHLTRTPEEQAQYGFTVPAAGGPPALQGADGTLLVRQLTNTVSDLSQGKLTYRGAVEYDLADENLLFVSYETGFRSGGFSIARGYESYRPEEIVALTVGSKNRFFGMIEANLELFAWDYKDQQLGRVSTDTDGNQAYIISNVGTSEMRGGELDLRAVITPLTRVNLSVQYLKSEYVDFTYLSAVRDLIPVLTTDNAPPPFLGCPYTANPDNANGTSAGYTVDCSGMPAFNAPEWTLNAGLSQSVPLGDYNLILNLDTQYRTAYAVGFEYLPYQFNESALRSSITATLVPLASQNQWSISAFVRNLEDVETLSFAASIRGTDVAGYGEPRTYGLRVSGSF
jgi:iron complex outermembrane receptor protein